MASAGQDYKLRYQDLIAALLVIVILVDLAVILRQSRRAVPLKVVHTGSQLSFRFDPNLATIDELQAIPGFNRKSAEKLVAYRTEYLKRFPNRVTFQNLSDIGKITGLSDKSLSEASDYLTFPGPEAKP